MLRLACFLPAWIMVFDDAEFTVLALTFFDDAEALVLLFIAVLLVTPTLVFLTVLFALVKAVVVLVVAAFFLALAVAAAFFMLLAVADIAPVAVVLTRFVLVFSAVFPLAAALPVKLELLFPAVALPLAVNEPVELMLPVVLPLVVEEPVTLTSFLFPFAAIVTSVLPLTAAAWVCPD